ncbi:hypothetical protein Lepto7375DRAFT_7802 [Leptolyngbya sp. PCC 7375]|nr:hypothetical protein Lepto7375DRAFT_7802 [Leptolyngbya sp. PCC 7375]
MHITLMVWYLQLCMPSAHFLVDPYGFWVTGFVSGSQGKQSGGSRLIDPMLNCRHGQLFHSS